MATCSFPSIVGPAGAVGTTGATGPAGSNENPTSPTPSTGDTVTCTPAGLEKLYYIDPAGALADLTITLDTGTASGQILNVVISQDVTTLVVTSANIITATALPVSATAGDHLSFTWDGNQSKWIRTV